MASILLFGLVLLALLGSIFMSGARPDNRATPSALFSEPVIPTPGIHELDLSHRGISDTLPAEIRQMGELEILNVSYNNMTNLPAEIGQLSNLRILNVSHNKLTGIPHEIGNLQKLKVLDLSGNDISATDLDVIRERLPATTQIIL